MHTVIVVEDQVVIVDGADHFVDLSSISIPANVHAVQWFGEEGWIEYTDGTPNLEITELPSWALDCVAAHAVAEAELQKQIDLDNTPMPADEEARMQRDMLLIETDWWAMSDRTMTPEQTAYRAALRDITAQAGFPDNIVWPTKPEGN